MGRADIVPPYNDYRRIAAVTSPWNHVHNEDCIEGLKKLADGAVDLAFADPPFNIGYEYDVYHDALESEQYLDWCRQVDGRGGSRAQADRHVLAGHRRRIRRRAEGHAHAGA